jgi:CRISPR-associated protein Csd1
MGGNIMILQSLKALAVREQLLSSADYEPRPVRWIIQIATDGSFSGLQETLDESTRKKKPGAKMMSVPRRSGRTVNDCAELLVDKSEYVLGFDPSGLRSEDKLAVRAALFQKETEACALSTGEAGVRSVCDFLGNGEGRGACVAGLKHAGAEPNDLIAFQRGEQLVHALPAVKQYFSSARRPSGEDGAQCLVCGAHATPVDKHPPVKVPGGSMSGVAVVSFNRPAFLSYGLEGNDNAPVCRDCADAYTTALSRCLSPAYPDPIREGQFLSRRSVRLTANTTAVFWAEEEDETLDLFSNLFEAADPEMVAALVKSPWSGRAAASGAARFYCLILGGAEGRATLRGTHLGLLGEVEENVAEYFRSLEVGQTNPSAIYTLLSSLALRGERDTLPPRLPAAMFLAILSGQPFPRFILDAAVARCRAERSVTWPRAALLRAYYQRSGKKEVAVALNTDLKEPGYLLGRLLAVLERLQAEAQGNPNKTIVERYYGSASTKPATVFPYLVRLSIHHAAKLNSAVYHQQRIGEVMDGLERLPPTLSLEQQGLFALGYYQQRQSFYKKKDDRPAQAEQPTDEKEVQQ